MAYSVVFTFWFGVSADPQDVDDRIPLIGERLLKEGLILRAERKYTKPKPGLKRLVKWPRTLVRVPPEQVLDNRTSIVDRTQTWSLHCFQPQRITQTSGLKDRGPGSQGFNCIAIAVL